MPDLLPDLNAEYFCTTFAEARAGFRSAIDALDPAMVRDRRSYEHPLAGPDGGPLECDLVHIGASDLPRCLLVLISGTHGVEGFAGSAVQTDSIGALARILAGMPELGVVLIHALNPWGFAWLRRYDHQGVDLNRNFVDFPVDQAGNPDYEFVHGRLMAEAGLSDRQLPALWEGVGRETFMAAVTRGQYQYADGLFYGGQAPSWSRRVVEQITRAPVFEGAERIAVIDLHTGLGPYGYGEIINDHFPDSKSFQLVRDWYGDNACSTLLGESVSGIKSGLMDYYWHRLLGDRGCFVTLEFGTYSADRLFLNLFREQQLHNRLRRRGEPRDLEHEHIQELKQFFCPNERSWRQQVLFRARQVMSLAVSGLST